jgi:hypothetical protein
MRVRLGSRFFYALTFPLSRPMAAALQANDTYLSQIKFPHTVSCSCQWQQRAENLHPQKTITKQ